MHNIVFCYTVCIQIANVFAAVLRCLPETFDVFLLSTISPGVSLFTVRLVQNETLLNSIDANL
jgi:hypothetical protein